MNKLNSRSRNSGKGRGRGGLFVALAIAVIALGGATTFYIWSLSSLSSAQKDLESTERAYESAAQVVAEAEAAAESEQQQAALTEQSERLKAQENDRKAQAIGFTKVDEGVYAYFHDASEITCGNWNCGYVTFYTPNGCPNHLFAEVAWEIGGVIVGSDNAMSPALGPDEMWVTEFVDLTNAAETYRITQASCR